MDKCILCSLGPFPPISWWAGVVASNEICFNDLEDFRKMTFRNRYSISGSNNPITLTIPIEQGRNHKAPMNEVKIFNSDNWQKRQWRTLVSVYKRTPYFEYYEPSLAQLFSNNYTQLIDFNLVSINWVKQQLKLGFSQILLSVLSTESQIQLNSNGNKPTNSVEKNSLDFPRYYQIFEDKIGYQPDLCILDLLFSEGPRAGEWLLKLNRHLQLF